MKKTLKIISIILIILIVLLSALAYWQRDNLKALKIAMTYNTNEIADQMSKQNQELKKQIEIYFPDGIRDFTPEEIEQIKNGKATEQQILANIVAEAVTSSVQNSTKEIKIDTPEQKESLTKELVNAIITVVCNSPDLNVKSDSKTLEKVISKAVSEALDKTTDTTTTQSDLKESIANAVTSAIQVDPNITVEKNEGKTLEKVVGDAVNKTLQSNTNIPDNKTTTDSNEKSGNSASKPATATSKQQEIIGRYTAQMYALEGEYVGKIEGIIAAAYAEYKSMGNGKNNKDLQISIATSYIGQFTALESQCDAAVATLLSNMQSELSAIGADTSIVSTMQSAYESEKATQRAYYISKFTS